MKPKISVIMPISKEPILWLKQSIDSILGQTFSDFEFIIILDEPSNIEAKKLVKTYEKKDARLIFLENKKNIGLAASLNKGIRIARGKYIARMDGDDISLPRRFETQYNLLEKTDADITCTNRTLINEKSKKIGQVLYKTDSVLNLKKTIFTLEPNPVVHPTIMGKAEIFKKNPYDERFRNSQDFEMWLRLIKKKVKFHLIEAPLIQFRVPKQSYDVRIKKNRNYTKYTMKALAKNWNRYFFNIWFYTFMIRSLFVFFVSRLPKKLVYKIIKIKDGKK